MTVQREGKKQKTCISFTQPRGNITKNYNLYCE